MSRRHKSCHFACWPEYTRPVVSVFPFPFLVQPWSDSCRSGFRVKPGMTKAKGPSLRNERHSSFRQRKAVITRHSGQRSAAERDPESSSDEHYYTTLRLLAIQPVVSGFSFPFLVQPWSDSCRSGFRVKPGMTKAKGPSLRNERHSACRRRKAVMTKRKSVVIPPTQGRHYSSFRTSATKRRPSLLVIPDKRNEAEAVFPRHSGQRSAAERDPESSSDEHLSTTEHIHPDCLIESYKSFQCGFVFSISSIFH